MPNRVGEVLLLRALVISGVLVGLSPLWFGVPEAEAVQIEQQGLLQTLSGQSVDGEYPMTFTLYKNPYSTTKLWAETWPSVSVVNGVFQVPLGGVNNLDPLLLGAHDELWLSVQVGDEPELPRSRLLPVPTAVAVEHALSTSALSAAIPSLSCSGCIDDSDLADASVTSAALALDTVLAENTSFGWAASPSPEGPASATAGVACLACISKSELAFDVAYQTDLLFVGTVLAKLGCINGEHPIVTLNEFGKAVWTCARATTSYGFAVTDPWGHRWDGVPRPPLDYVDAVAVCEGLGGRLPTATEIYRNSADKGTGAIAVPAESDWLWTRVPRAPNQVIVVRAGSGQVGYSSLTTVRRYRCIWPDFELSDFVGDHCNGPPGAGCHPIGEHHFMDAMSRAPLPLGSAVAECRFSQGRLPRMGEFEAAIRNGLPGGPDELHWTTEQLEDCYGTDCASHGAPFWTLSWSGTDVGWTGPQTARWHYESARFRCIGLRDRATLTPPQGGGVADDPLFMRVDSIDRNKSPFYAAIDACMAAKGHLLENAELWSLILGGLPEPGDESLWTATHGDLEPITLFWTTPGQWLWPSQGFSNSHFNEETFFVSKPYRCGYYATVPPGGPQPPCEGGCFQVVKGNVRLFADGIDRSPATYYEALDTCAASGGRLPSGRDAGELIRAGLPNGTKSAVWTTSTGYDGTFAYKLVVHWFNVNTTWSPPNILSDPDNGFGKRTVDSEAGENHEEAYRCVWSNEAL